MLNTGGKDKSGSRFREQVRSAEILNNLRPLSPAQVFMIYRRGD